MYEHGSKISNLFAAMSLSVLANKEQYDRFHHYSCGKKVMRSKLKMSIFVGWKKVEENVTSEN